jgi:protein-S-isoprenylcysteine O-methyltransferase Ste14
MTKDGERNAPGSPTTADAANLGIVRPPLVYLLTILGGLGLHFAIPLTLMPWGLHVPLGAAGCLLAVSIFVAAVRTFRTAGTPVPGDQPTTSIVRTGPYRFTRNPIYLAFTLLQVGIAIWVNTPWLLLTLIPAILLMSLIVIPREESYLETHFPAAYPSYRQAVRRWL